jgi:hypothetical protein
VLAGEHGQAEETAWDLDPEIEVEQPAGSAVDDEADHPAESD